MQAFEMLNPENVIFITLPNFMALRSKIFETELQKTCDFPKYWMAKWAGGHKLLCHHINLKNFKSLTFQSVSLRLWENI